MQGVQRKLSNKGKTEFIKKEETSELSNVEVNSDLDRSCFSGMMGDTV